MNEPTNIRRIVRTRQGTNFLLNRYEARKQQRVGDLNEWEAYGRKYDLKGIDSLVRESTLSFLIDSDVLADLEIYRAMRVRRAAERLSTEQA